MKIYTRTGDTGTTSLLGGTRVSKNHLRIDAYGTIDELNSLIGLLSATDKNSERAPLYLHIQERLFTVGSSLAAETEQARDFKPDLEQQDIKALEEAMDDMNRVLPVMKNFILPGGHSTVAHAHVARCVCRRAERRVVQLAEHEPVEEIIVVFLNRLSDYLFVVARMIAMELGVEERKWTPRS